MDIWMDAYMDGWVYVCVELFFLGIFDSLLLLVTVVRADIWTDGCMGGCVYGWMHGWMDAV